MNLKGIILSEKSQANGYLLLNDILEKTNYSEREHIRGCQAGVRDGVRVWLPKEKHEGGFGAVELFCIPTVVVDTQI